MDLKEKDVVVIAGPSRVGKGSLLAALSGVKMQYICSEDMNK